MSYLAVQAVALWRWAPVPHPTVIPNAARNLSVAFASNAVIPRLSGTRVPLVAEVRKLSTISPSCMNLVLTSPRDLVTAYQWVVRAQRAGAQNTENLNSKLKTLIADDCRSAPRSQTPRRRLAKQATQKLTLMNKEHILAEIKRVQAFKRRKFM